MTDRSPSLTECSIQELKDEIKRRAELRRIQREESKSKYTPAEYIAATNENRRRDMLNMRRAGLTYSAIGKRFGIHGYTVSGLIHKQERIEKYDNQMSTPFCFRCKNTAYDVLGNVSKEIFLLQCRGCGATRHAATVYFIKFPKQGA